MTTTLSIDEIAGLTRQFIEKELRPYELVLENSSDMTRERRREIRLELVAKSRALGLYSHSLPEEKGGGGLSLREHVAVAMESGRVSMGVRDVVFGPPHSILYASEEQESWFVKPLIEGTKFTCAGLTEPSGGSDLLSIKTRAIAEGDHFLLRGEKAFISSADQADFVVVLAVSNPEATSHKQRFTAMIVETDAPGLEIQEMPKLGWHGHSINQLYFDDVRVERDHVLGEVHGGWAAMFGSWIQEGRLGVAAYCAGAVGYALEVATEYALERTTFGRPLAENQVIQFWLADMQIAFDTCKALVYHAADVLTEAGGDPSKRRAAISIVAGAKVFTAESLGKSVDTLVQIFGGAGLLKGSVPERLYRDCRIFRIGEGSSEMLRQQIARDVIKRGR